MIQANPSTVSALIDYNATHFPDAPALTCEGVTRTNAEWAGRALQLAAAFEAAGLVRQDRVSVLSRNRLEYMDAYAAGWVSGIIIATVSYRLAPPEMEFILNDTAPKILIFEAIYEEIVAGLRNVLRGVDRFVCIGGQTDWAEDFETFLASGSSHDLSFRARPDDFANLIYTSGTTGRPKGCVHSQGGLLKKARTLAHAQPSGLGDRFLIVMPLFHVGAVGVSIAHLSRSGSLHLMREFDAQAVLDTIARDRIGTVLLAPTMVQMLLDTPGIADADLSSLHTIIYSASPMPSNTLRAGIERFGPIFVQYYGQTEVISTYLPRELHRPDGDETDRALLLSAGVPFVDTRIRIVGEDGRDLPIGEVGEILVSTPGAALGYWNASAATLESFRDGWWATGDIGRLDARSFLYIVDRKKDIIISGGENIYSREVEEALLLHPAVAEAAVVGQPDPLWGESVCAFVRLQPAADVGEAALIAHVRSQIASYKKPKQVRFLDALPKLVSGKIDKIALRRRASNSG